MHVFPQASYITMIEDGSGYTIVFDEGSSEAFAEFHTVMNALGVWYQPPVLRPEGIWVAFVRTPKGISLPTVTKSLKVHFKPLLQVSLTRPRLEVINCSTGQHNSAELHYGLLEGFGPQDVNTFHQQLVSRLRQMPLKDLILDPGEDEQSQSALLCTLGQLVRDHAKAVGAYLPFIDLNVSHCCF